MIAPEYQALTQAAAVVDLSARGRLCLLGADRPAFLHGQVTNNVKALSAGQSCYAALANNKGKLTSDLNIFILADEILLDFEPGLSDKVKERLEKFIIADDVQIIDASAAYGLLSIIGPQAPAIGREFSAPSAPGAIAPVGDWYVASTRRAGLPAVDCFVPVHAVPEALERLQRFVPMLVPVNSQALETVRIEHGIPRFGGDMDENTLVPEAIEEAISYSKGCYIGQEVIARIRTYGQVAKALRGLRFDAGAAVPPVGEKILHDGREVGWITSAVFSPKLQRPIALGYVRKECNQIGARLGAGAAICEVVATPFQP